MRSGIARQHLIVSPFNPGIIAVMPGRAVGQGNRLGLAVNRPAQPTR
ncbi:MULTISPECIES: hypothetical protein [Streptomyces]|uniref:Uncharacterized protein n=1 Tax=Streptomyces tardus TaxID=2780544 RepID=A0A949N9R1_9ACTN|nr:MULTISPECIES: hypothetical protein [Streptomyces]MBU7599148.1 hypothetical protein [Streptomyces tardus]RPK51729.1 hypothetical protein EES40_04000 [Streptomyces sp. ADI93-02]